MRIQSHFFRSAFLPICFVLAAVVILATCPKEVHAEKWTDLRGTKTIDAQMIGLWDDSVVLELANGKRVTVKLENLRGESRIQAVELARGMEQQRNDQIAQRRQRAESASAAAPHPLPEPNPASEYVPPTADMSAEDFANHVTEQLQAGHLRVAFDMLPPSYQRDVERVTKVALTKVNPQAFEAVTGLLYDSGNTLVTKQNWFFTYPRLENMSSGTPEKLREWLVPVAGFLQVGFDPQAMNLENLKSSSIDDWLTQYDQKTAPYLSVIMTSMYQNGGIPEMTFEPGENGLVNVTVTKGDSTEVTTAQKVEGFWVSSNVAASWNSQVDQAIASLLESENGSLGAGSFTQIVSSVSPFLEPLKNAPTADGLHAAIDSLISLTSSASELTEFASAIPAMLGVSTESDDPRAGRGRRPAAQARGQAGRGRQGGRGGEQPPDYSGMGQRGGGRAREVPPDYSGRGGPGGGGNREEAPDYGDGYGGR